MKEKIIVAVKDVSGKQIRPGKFLGKFRSIEFARIAFPGIAQRAGKRNWEIGIFKDSKLVS